jgi:hypothetical protein
MFVFHAGYKQYITSNMLSDMNDVLPIDDPAHIEAIIADAKEENTLVNAIDKDGVVAQQNVDEDTNNSDIDDKTPQSVFGQAVQSDAQTPDEEVVPSFWENILCWFFRLFESMLESTQWKTFR